MSSNMVVRIMPRLPGLAQYLMTLWLDKDVKNNLLDPLHGYAGITHHHCHFHSRHYPSREL